MSLRPSRNPTMSLKVLLNKLDASKASLNRLISESDDIVQSSDEKILRKCLRNLKDSNNKFRSESISLSNWYRKNGSHSCASEINEERRHLYDEYQMAYKTVNERICELGLPPGSSVGDASEYRDTNITEWLCSSEETEPSTSKLVVTSAAADDVEVFARNASVVLSSSGIGIDTYPVNTRPLSFGDRLGAAKYPYFSESSSEFEGAIRSNFDTRSSDLYKDLPN